MVMIFTHPGANPTMTALSQQALLQGIEHGAALLLDPTTSAGEALAVFQDIKAHVAELERRGCYALPQPPELHDTGVYVDTTGTPAWYATMELAEASEGRLVQVGCRNGLPLYWRAGVAWPMDAKTAATFVEGR